MRSSVIFLLFAVTLSACLPRRDNHLDPANAPSATLRVVDESIDAAGSCGGPSAEVFTAIGRSHCIVLDASGSTDPQSDIDHFEYDFSLTGEEPFTVLASNATSRFPLTDVQKRELLPPFAHITFRVTVVDSHGSRNSALATATLANHAPIARAGAPVLLPLGGFAWNPTMTQFDVTLDGSGSFDSDGDPLSYCWTIAPSTTAVCSASPTISVSAPLTQSRARATLRVFDGRPELPVPQTFASAESFTMISVEVPPVWFVSASEASLLERIDPRQNVLSVPNVRTLAPLGTAEVLVASGGSIPPVIIARAPVGSPLASTATASLGVESFIGLKMLADAAADRVWVYYVGKDGPAVCGGSVATPTATIVSLEGPALTPARCVRLPWGSSFGPDAPFTLDAAGNAWVGFGFGSELQRVGPTPTTDLTITGPGLPILTTVARRPGTDEIWQSRTENLLGMGTGNNGPSYLVRTTSDNAATGTRIDLPSRGGGYLTWISADEFWLSTFDQGAYLVDANVLSFGRPFDEAVVAAFPDLVGGLYLFADTFGGGVWSNDFLVDGLVFLSSSGHYTNLGGGFEFVPQFVDANGDLWMASDTQIARRGAVTRAGIVATAQAPVSPTIAVDARDGGFWAASLFAGQLKHVGADGSTLRTYSHTTGAGGDAPLPLLGVLSIEPGARSIWAQVRSAISPLSAIIRLDFSTPDPTRVDVLVASQIGTIQPDLLIAGAPIPATTPFAWVRTNSGTTSVVSTLATDGTLASRLSIAQPEFFQAAALQTRTNRLCVVTTEFGPGTTIFRLRSVPTSGAATLLTTLTLTSPANVDTLATSNSPDLCWIGTRDGASTGTTLTAWRLSTTLPAVRTIAEGAGIRSILPQGQDDVWAVVTGSNPSEPDGTKVHFQAWSTGTSTFTKRDVYEATRTGDFLCPNCYARTQ